MRCKFLYKLVFLPQAHSALIYTRAHVQAHSLQQSAECTECTQAVPMINITATGKINTRATSLVVIYLLSSSFLLPPLYLSPPPHPISLFLSLSHSPSPFFCLSLSSLPLLPPPFSTISDRCNGIVILVVCTRCVHTSLSVCVLFIRGISNAFPPYTYYPAYIGIRRTAFRNTNT